jgi:RNA polymerase sigma factor (TIGR02999 family)
MMRRILVDRARRHRYQKRGGRAVHVDIENVALVSPERPDDLVALDDALQRLERQDPRQAAVVELRYFAGLTAEEIARCLGVAPITVKRDWALAKSFLHREIRRSDPTPED